jgi:curved DNA-binding protein CbpA
VAPSATAAEIKAAFRRKAVEYHPDRCKLSNAAVLFQKVTQAFGVLGIAESRPRYDTSTVETLTTSRTGRIEQLSVSRWGIATDGDRVIGRRGQWTVFAPGGLIGTCLIIDGGNATQHFERQPDASAAAHAIAAGRSRRLQGNLDLLVDVWSFHVSNQGGELE